jgi:hypothetical protein
MHNVGGATPASHNDMAGADPWTVTASDVISGGRDAIYLTGALIIPGQAAVNRIKRSTDSGVTYATIAGTTINRLTTMQTGGMNGGGMGATQFSLTTDAGLTFVDQVAHGLNTASGSFLSHNATHYVMGGLNAMKDWSASTGLTTPALPVGIGAGAIESHAFDGDSIEVASSGTNQVLRRVSGGVWTLTTQTFTHPVVQFYWTGANFIAVTTPAGGGDGQIWTSPDGSSGSWTLRPTFAGYALFCVAQEYG